ncbi:MAG: hypothetical protein QW561_01245 [Candidatus Aenigmatarchaeota archaeon]
MGFLIVLITISILFTSVFDSGAASGTDFHPDMAILYTTNVLGEIEPCG